MLFSQLNVYVLNFTVACSSSSTEVVVIGFPFVLLVLSALIVDGLIKGEFFRLLIVKIKHLRQTRRASRPRRRLCKPQSYLRMFKQ